MHELYFKALLRLILLLSVSILVAYVCVSRSYRHEVFLGPSQDAFSWHLKPRTDATEKGRSEVRSKAAASRVMVDFTLAGVIPNPYAATAVVFTGQDGKPKLLDVSNFSGMTFEARCSPSNTLSIGIATFDNKISKPGDLLTYRTPSAFFDCDEGGTSIELDLTRLTVPQWWFDLFKLNLSQQGYSLNQVAQMEFGTSNRSPVGVPSRVEISQLTLHGREYGYLYFLGAFLLLAWSAFGIWFFKKYAVALANDVQTRLQKDMPLIAYQQLSLEPHRDKEKSAVLKLLATRYADPELDLDKAVSETGVNRNKINDILKAELGYTFSAYLNKLRLTEASRLLLENQNQNASVAEIAYSVGYKNVSYFNKLFKEEYKCTPKALRDVCNKNLQAH
jgi:AraC-like DNA-binding protein